MARVTVGDITQGGVGEQFVDISALVPSLPPLTDGTQLDASVTDMGTLGKVILIGVPNAPASPAGGPAASPASVSEAHGPAAS